jgi:two-component system chemotaxis response regulator CheY
MNLRFLCVEDSPFQRAHLKRILAPLGEVFFAVNGIEGLAAFEKQLSEGLPFDLICLDLLMPEMDGQEMLARLRDLEEAYRIRKSQGVKVIVLTGLDDQENIFNAFRSRCDAYLTKPIQYEELMGYLKAWDLVA